MRSPSRRRPGPASPAVTGLAPALALVLVASQTALGGEAQATHEQGYPRCSDAPPAAIEGNTDGQGEENDADGTSYDTNWWFDADAGDSDVVLLTVRNACIDGYGQVQDADVSSATHRQKEAWGEDRLHVAPADGESGECTFTLTNRIRIAASWVLHGNGRNDATLRAQALDIDGNVHTWSRVFSVDPTVTSTTTTTKGGRYENGGTSGGSVSTGGASATSSTSGEVAVSGSTTDEVRTTSGSGVSGDDEVRYVIESTAAGSSCAVRIASAELVDIQAQTATDGIETTVKVPYFDTVNVVEASYAVDDPSEPGGVGTPGGEDPSPPGTGGGDEGGGPSTPGGDDGTTPETPGGGDPTLPGSSDEPQTPPTEETDGTEPAPDGTPPDADEPVLPGGTGDDPVNVGGV